MGLTEFFLAGLASPAGDSGLALAGDDRRADSAVAVQVRQADDDGELRRSDDHRSRHVGVSIYDHAQFAWADRDRRVGRDPAIDAALADRSFPRQAANKR